MNLSYNEIQGQSQLAFNRWKALWIDNCSQNKTKIATSLKDILNAYHDRDAILFAYGPSFEKNIDDFKKSPLFSDENVVIGCVDKAFKPLVERGIFPHYVIVADGSVDVKWLEGVPKEAIQRAFLISNVYASPDWARAWADVAGKKSIYWYLNKDNLNKGVGNQCGTADFFCDKAGYYEIIPAASNVGNSLVVFSRQILGIRMFYLCGYDYCWYLKGTYYGSQDHPRKYLIGHFREVDNAGRLVWTSTNMEFSAKWLDNYIFVSEIEHKAKFYNCTGAGLLKRGISFSFLDIKEERRAA